MEPELAAKGILKRNDWGDSQWYRIECECSDPNHGHEMCVEADDHSVDVTLYVDMATPFLRDYEYAWWSDGFLPKIRTEVLNFWITVKWRTRTAFRVLFRGNVEMQTSIILHEQEATNYAHALTSAVEDVKDFQAKKKLEKVTTDNGGD